MQRYNSMRGWFAYELWKLMKTNKDIFLLSGDLGYVMFDDIQKDYPDRFINTGAAEHSLIDIGVGLALKGKIPVCYSITPFLLYRGFEAIRNYINFEKIPVILAGSGRGKDYVDDGFSHWCDETNDVMRIFKNIRPYYPKTQEEIPKLLRHVVERKMPSFISLIK